MRADKAERKKKMKVNDEKRITIEVDGEKVTAPASFFNNISIYATEAGKIYDDRGYTGLAKAARKIGKEIYDKLIAIGYYD